MFLISADDNNNNTRLGNLGSRGLLPIVILAPEEQITPLEGGVGIANWKRERVDDKGPRSRYSFAGPCMLISKVIELDTFYSACEMHAHCPLRILGCDGCTCHFFGRMKEPFAPNVMSSEVRLICPRTTLPRTNISRRSVIRAELRSDLLKPGPIH